MPNDSGMTPAEVEKWRRMAVDHERVMRSLFGDGNGDKGLLFRFNEFFTRHEEWEEQRDRIDKRRAKLHYTLLGGLIALVVSLLSVMAGMWIQGHKIVTTEKPAISERNSPTVAIQ